MKLLIKFPTRNRKNKFFETLDRYYEFCGNINNVNFLITLDDDDTSMNSKETIKKFEDYPNLKYVFGKSASKIDAVNRDINFINDWDIVLLASDDMIPQITGYDNIIIENMVKYYPDTDGVLWFNDGFQGNKLNTLSIIGKKYFDRFKYIYFPEYKSTWCDNEFMEVANTLNKQTYIDQVIIKHEHPDWGYGGRDNIHIKNSNDLKFDMSLFYFRKSINFGL